MPSRIDEAGHTKASDDPVAEHWGESQRAKRSLVGFEPTSAHTYESEIQRSTTYATRLPLLTGKYDKDITEGFFKLRQDSDTRGHSLKIFKERPRLESRKHSFAFRVADPWNSLTEDIAQAPSVASFERRLDKHWRNHPLMYNY